MTLISDPHDKPSESRKLIDLNAIEILTDSFGDRNLKDFSLILGDLISLLKEAVTLKLPLRSTSQC
jgi:hypothetical protein